MKPIFKSIYGSYLYGTSVPTSDKDIKGVFLPSAEEILMVNVPSTFTENSNKNSDRKNSADDTDYQLFSLKKFLFDVIGGQTYALELLFSPETCWIETPDPLWFKLLANRDRLVSKNVTAMVSYARAQAYKYGDKGKRLDVFRDVVEFFKEKMELQFRMQENGAIYGDISVRDSVQLIDFLKIMEKHKEFISIHKKDNDSSNVEYLDVNGVMVPLGSVVKYAYEVYKPRLDEYGARAKQAAADKGNDLKAIYHAVRIANQAEELLKTGFITLPRPEAPLLLKIRNGELEEAAMKTIIDESFERVRETEKSTSSLRDKPDKKWIDEFLLEAHLQIIKDEHLLDQNHFDEEFFKATKKFGW